MRKVIYLLSDGKLGLPGASKMFVEMVAVKKDNPSKYYKILKEAQVKSAHLKKMLAICTYAVKRLRGDKLLISRIHQNTDFVSFADRYFA